MQDRTASQVRKNKRYEQQYQHFNIPILLYLTHYSMEASKSVVHYIKITTESRNLQKIECPKKVKLSTSHQWNFTPINEFYPIFLIQRRIKRSQVSSVVSLPYMKLSIARAPSKVVTECSPFNWTSIIYYFQREKNWFSILGASKFF